MLIVHQLNFKETLKIYFKWSFNWFLNDTKNMRLIFTRVWSYKSEILQSNRLLHLSVCQPFKNLNCLVYIFLIVIIILDQKTKIEGLGLFIVTLLHWIYIFDQNFEKNQLLIKTPIYLAGEKKMIPICIVFVYMTSKKNFQLSLNWKKIKFSKKYFSKILY